MRRTKDKKKQDYLQWKKSGESKLAFCKRKGIGYHTFLNDCKEYAKEADPGFSQISFPGTAVIGERIEIYERDGRRILLPLDTPVEIMRMFVRGYARAK